MILFILKYSDIFNGIFKHKKRKYWKISKKRFYFLFSLKIKMLDEYYYEHPNEVAENYDDVDFDSREFPDFIRVILLSVSFSYKAKEDFVNKFVIYYFTDEKFQDATNNCIFLFVAREYYGLYKTQEEALEVAHSTGCKGHEITLVPMFFTKIDENLESATAIKSHIVKVTNSSGQNFESILYDYITVTGGILSENMVDELDDLISSEYIVDTGRKINN